MSTSLTHFALHVEDAQKTAGFFERFAGMQVIRTFGGRGGGAKWLRSADASNAFVIVLLEGDFPIPGAAADHAAGRELPVLTSGPQAPTSPLSHFGFAVDSREQVDAIADDATREGVLAAPPRYAGEVIGYHCYLRDPNGHSVEFSFGQALE
jgi:catechol 2,3-dioxygenase-like lactoylglutathione lyase family enzyme